MDGVQSGKEQEGIVAGILLLLYMTLTNSAATNDYNNNTSYIHGRGQNPLRPQGWVEDDISCRSSFSKGQKKDDNEIFNSRG